jgi:probable phosphoglycerate mutase
MRLILIRHGQTPSNVGGHLDTAVPGPGLTELGHDQAAALPDALRHEGIEAIYVSNMVRTRLTAQPLAEALQLRPEERDGLREIAAGDLEMRNDWPSVTQYLDTVRGWADDVETRMPGGENGREVFERFDTVVREIAASTIDGKPVTTAAIVSHGAMLHYWVPSAAHNLSPDYSSTHQITNTAVIVLEGHPDAGWTVETWVGEAVGGAALTALDADGPTADG